MPCSGCKGRSCRNCSSCEANSRVVPFQSTESKKHEKNEERKVSYLNLKRVKRQLKNKLGWSDEKIRMVEKGYREFLSTILQSGHDGRCRPPNDDIDQFWHFHILDTPKYAHDCQKIFGFFIHHIPE